MLLRRQTGKSTHKRKMDTTTLIGIISLLVAIIGLSITILEKWDVIAPRIVAVYKAIAERLPSLGLNLSRRHFIGTSILAIGGGATTLSYKFFDFGNSKRSNRWSKYTDETNFVVNERNGVIHLKGICDDHLPIEQTVIENSISSNLHGAKRQQITNSVLKQLPDNLREELLIDAITKSPTSTHLYKHLVKLWGRKKEYSKIHEFLSVNIKFLESKLEFHKTPKQKRKYSKAISELRIKKSHAEYLAGISKYS